LGRFLNNGDSKISYRDVERDLGLLLKNFAPYRKHVRPQYPFWRLQQDGVWNIEGAEEISTNSSGDPSVTELQQRNPMAGFPDEICSALKKDKRTAYSIVRILLDENFPSSIHEDILQSVGINLNTEPRSESRQRSPDFRERVLRAYEYRCAVCGFDVRLGNIPIALEAAHVKWVQAGGPCKEENGIALCAMHHKLFDRGAFSLTPTNELIIMVSDSANGNYGFGEWLMNFHQKPLKKPQKCDYVPSENYIRWHLHEVFQGEYRE
jgi:putative restriction endonuclease